MVSLDLYHYREEVKRAILVRKGEIDQEWDPFIASWLAYAFTCEKDLQSLRLQELLQRLDSWSQDEAVWQSRRNIGALFFIIWLHKQLNLPINEMYAEKAKNMLLKLNFDDKFSPLRNPEQVFLIALGVSALEQSETNDFLVNKISSQVRGPLARQVLFNAAIEELGKHLTLSLSEPKDVTDVISVLWWVERYDYDADKSQYWSQLESNVDTLLLFKTEEFDTRIIVSEWELALMFEAILQETNRPNPNMLFDYYPLHSRIKRIAESNFKRNDYSGAVFEACKALEDYLRDIASSGDEAVPVIKKVLGDPCQNPSKTTLNPIVKLNSLDSTSTDYKSQLNEQIGFSHFGVGIFKAFRNPKGHQPKDKILAKIDPYEALDQLVSISLVMKRIENAKISNK